ncbi:MAG: hypothetical protein HYV40_06525 [Candidatus Levybacteria bacterium]|nr:hypothetical protein [Candidatus Levybacteria bacterium]
MNTLRFFLLLCSLFLFAIVLQPQPEKSTRDVLSDTASEKNAVLESVVATLYYPEGSVVSEKTTTLVLRSNDNPDDIVRWYEKKLGIRSAPSSPPAHSFEKKEQTFLLSGTINEKTFMVKIHKKNDNETFITIKATAS